MPSNSRYVFTGYFSTDQLTKLLSINKNNLTKKIWLVIHQPEHTISIKYKQKLLFYNSNFHMPHKYLAVKHLLKKILLIH